MGVDCKLYINAKYGVREVVTMLENMEGVGPINPQYREDHAFLIFDYKGENRQMMVFKTSNHGPDCTGLSLGQWGSATDIMTTIASIVGGFLQNADYTDACTMFQDPHEGNAQFILKHQILTNKLTSKHSHKLADAVAAATGYERTAVQFNPDTLLDEPNPLAGAQGPKGV